MSQTGNKWICRVGSKKLMPKHAMNIIIRVKMNFGIFNKGNISSAAGSSLCPLGKTVLSHSGNMQNETKNNKNIEPPTTRKGN